jgi:hypothetical protein
VSGRIQTLSLGLGVCGRPRKAPLTDVLTALLQSSCADDPAQRTYAQLIAEMLLKRACKGDIRAAREIAC